jgi:hypothetical protein
MTEVMDFIRRSFTVLGAIVFAVLVLAVLTPRAERGVATALGQAAPAPVQVYVVRTFRTFGLAI